MFPMRPYLPSLVEALEDSDPSVRECAKTSVVELFTGPGVTDAARADLKKELTKKGVRKTIVDLVLSKVLAVGAGSTTPAMSETGSENGDASSGGHVAPMSLMNKKPGTGTMSRSVSQPNVEKLSRPASRSAIVSPIPPDPPAGGASGGSEVKPVYVSYLLFVQLPGLITYLSYMTDRLEPRLRERVRVDAQALRGKETDLFAFTLFFR